MRFQLGVEARILGGDLCQQGYEHAESETRQSLCRPVSTSAAPRSLSDLAAVTVGDVALRQVSRQPAKLPNRLV